VAPLDERYKDFVVAVARYKDLVVVAAHYKGFAVAVVEQLSMDSVEPELLPEDIEDQTQIPQHRGWVPVPRI